MCTTIPLPNDRVLYNYDIYTTKPLQCTIYNNVQNDYSVLYTTKWWQCIVCINSNTHDLYLIILGIT